MLDHSAGLPLTILTGFLGAGKTTLLNRILTGDHGLRIAVLINDFGSLQIDAEMVVQVEDDVVSLATGCICCTIRDDLTRAILDVAKRPERPEYVLLEASGVAEPGGIALTFTHPEVREHIRLDSIICVVDAENALDAPEHMGLKLWQIGCADLVILNKTDLVEADHLTRVREWVGCATGQRRAIEAVRCDVPLDVLLGTGRPTAPLPAADHHAEAGFASWSYETDRPLSMERLRKAVSRLPGHIYRAKGVIHAVDPADQRILVQVVGERVDVSLQGPWGSDPPRTRLVVIGSRVDFSREALQQALEACVEGA